MEGGCIDSGGQDEKEINGDSGDKDHCPGLDAADIGLCAKAGMQILQNVSFVDKERETDKQIYRHTHTHNIKSVSEAVSIGLFEDTLSVFIPKVLVD